jgi:hypothetical protein
MWSDYRLDLVDDGRSEAPRIPSRQVRQLHPGGVPSSWELITEHPVRPSWVTRLTGGVVSVLLTIAAALSGVVAAVAGVGGELLAGTARLAGLVGFEAGLVGRLVAVIVIGIPAVRIGWRLARWGVAPIGDDR